MSRALSVFTFAMEKFSGNLDNILEMHNACLVSIEDGLLLNSDCKVGWLMHFILNEYQVLLCRSLSCVILLMFHLVGAGRMKFVFQDMHITILALLNLIEDLTNEYSDFRDEVCFHVCSLECNFILNSKM